MDLALLESHKRNCSDCYQLAVTAMREGHGEKAVMYAELAKKSAEFIIDNSPNREDRKRYKIKREKCDLLISGDNDTSGTIDINRDSVEDDNRDNKRGIENVGDSESSVVVVKPKLLTLEEALKQLDDLEGLDEVKQQIHDWVKQIKVFKLRKSRGIKVPEISYHMVFTGNPGTGKTTVARLLAQIYLALGIIKKGQYVEAKRADLVAGYVGQTALKTKEAINRAIGGVLFIDEAYTLANGGTSDFGQESIDTILKEMEDRRDQFVVVVAGYDDLMKNFIESNPGLKSRFKNFLRFADYTGEQLMKIFEGLCKKNQYVILPAAYEKLTEYFNNLYEHRDKNFGNGRAVRNLFEEIVTKQSVRIAGLPNPDNSVITEIGVEDLPI